LLFYRLGPYQERTIHRHIKPEYSSTATYCNIAPVCFVGTLSVNYHVEFRPSLKPH